MNRNDKLGEEPDPLSPPERRKPAKQTTERRNETVGMLETGGSLLAERSAIEDGVAANLGSCGSKAGVFYIARSNHARSPSREAEVVQDNIGDGASGRSDRARHVANQSE